MPFVIKDGKEVFVSDKRAQELVASGEATIPEGQVIRTAEGLGAISQAQAGALAGVTTPISGEQVGAEIAEASLQEEFGEGVGNELRGFLEGTASGLTFGLSDAILAGTIEPTGLRERRRRTSFGIVGELTGAIAPAQRGLDHQHVAPAGAGFGDHRDALSGHHRDLREPEHPLHRAVQLIAAGDQQ